MSTCKFRTAVNDFRFLKNRGYSNNSLLNLVGDRYRLSRTARNCLMRGISDRVSSLARKKKVIKPSKVRGMQLWIDWYNVLITVEGYLKGGLLFLSDDGVIRDASAVHGSYRASVVTDPAIQVILDSCMSLFPKEMGIFLDAPVSYSGQMKTLLLSVLEELSPGFPISVEVVPSPDYILKSRAGVKASSDSIIMDAPGYVLDLPRLVLKNRYGYVPKKIEDLNMS
ncbi:MAG: DUF434 domain-containing protein [Spirochaetaceae bacterium]|nr:MAG: DUF434 domain-containing protein [Spirochaetaceae bacterium]